MSTSNGKVKKNSSASSSKETSPNSTSPNSTSKTESSTNSVVKSSSTVTDGSFSVFGSVSPVSVEELSEKEIENCVAKVVNNMVAGTQNFISTAKERVFGDTWWVPKDDREIVEIPKNGTKKLITLKENNPYFALCQSDYTTGTVYQVTMKWKDKRLLSLIRMKKKQECRDYFEHLVQYNSLFRFIDNVKDLKVLITLLVENAGWQPVHVAAKMGQKSYFEKAKEDNTLKKLLNATSQPEQRLPLHIVIESNHVELAKYLLSTGATSISATDVRGQNALHFASFSSSPMVTALCEFPEAKECINWLNKDGCTPLFMSITNCRPTVVAALLKNGATLNILCQGRSALHEAMLQNKSSVKEVVKTLVETSPETVLEADPLTGNSALHLATNKTSLTALLEACPQLDLNVLNKNGRAALHCHTFRGDLGCLVAMSMFDANLDVKDQEGNTPLHLAVYNGNLEMVKALLVLGADPNPINHNGHSPRHLAARSTYKTKDEMLRCLVVCGAKRCHEDVSGCASSCLLRSLSRDESRCNEMNLMPETENTHPPQLPDFEEFAQERSIERVKSVRKNGESVKILLSLDGGGIRGLILTKILMFIENELGEPIIDYVDWMAGTSTGAFLSGGLAVGKSLKDCQNIYFRFKDQLFESWSRPYNAEVLEKLIKSEMGEETTMDMIEKPINMMITTTAADVQPLKLHLFRNYRLPLSDEENEKLGYVDPKSILLWKALRCSSAAPTYFTSFEKKYVDGGLISNNPTTELMSEVHKYNEAVEFMKRPKEKVVIGCVLSIGTGRVPDTQMECFNISALNPLESMTALRNLGMLMVDQVTATEGLPVDRSRSWCHDMKIPYFRFSTPLSKEYVLDTKDDKEIIQMMWETIEYMCREKDEVRKLIDLLISLKK